MNEVYFVPFCTFERIIKKILAFSKKFISHFSVLFFRRKIVVVRLPAALSLSSALSFWRFEKPYSRIRKIHFPFSIFLTAQSALLLLAPMVFLTLFFEDATFHLNDKITASITR